jgi:hypothetical protein
MAGVVVTGARALDAAPTRRWLRRRVVGGVVAVVVGVVLVLAGVVVRARADDPRRAGPDERVTTATITAVHVVPNGKLGQLSTLTLAYRTEDGVARLADLGVGVPKPAYVVGVEVPVIYAQATPEQVQLEGVPTNPPLPWPVPVGLGVVGLVGGVLLARRARAIAATLRANPWVAARSTLVEASQRAAGRRPIARFLELDGAPDDEPVLAGPVSPRLVPVLVPEAWVAGTDRRFVVAAVGGAPLVAVHRARLRRPDAGERRAARTVTRRRPPASDELDR